MSKKEDVFIVEDMACEKCANTITTTLTNETDVSDIKIDLDTKEVTVDYDTEKVDVEEILSSLDNVGFPATIKKKP